VVPNKNTANVLDSLIRGRDLIFASGDRSYSLEEFAMGINLEIRDLDLCWGYAAIEPKLPTNFDKEAVISIGVARQTDLLAEMPTEEFGLSLSDLMDVGGAEVLQNVYAFGSIFLKSNLAPPATPSVIPFLLRGGDDGTGRRLLIHKDITVDEAIAAMTNGDVPPVTPPDGNVLEIFRFVMDITYFDSSNNYKNRIDTHIIDMRKPRGWGGFAEENMGVVLTPASIVNYDNNVAGVDISEKAVKDLVDTWVHLTTWEPDFLQFWKKSGGNVMPPRLEGYIKDVLGITLLP